MAAKVKVWEQPERSYWTAGCDRCQWGGSGGPLLRSAARFHAETNAGHVAWAERRQLTSFGHDA